MAYGPQADKALSQMNDDASYEDYAAVAMAFLDQAMVSKEGCAKIIEIVRDEVVYATEHYGKREADEDVIEAKLDLKVEV